MPVRPRRQRRARFAPIDELRLTMALDLGVGIGEHDRERLREAWQVLGPRLLADRPVTVDGPVGFWAFDPSVPDRLRDDGPQLVPVADVERVDRKRKRVHKLRAAWLADQRKQLR